MFAVETYAAVRRFVFVEGKSRREAARVFGLSRETIAKMCRYSAPPGYVRSKEPERPKLGPLVPVIDAILEADKTAPPKQRHTAKRIFERLRIEQGFAGGYTVVKDYVRLARTKAREMFVPLAHPPGHAQVDFGECIGVIGGVRTKLHVFCFDLPQSDACFIKAYPAETTEAFLDGHVSAFAFSAACRSRFCTTTSKSQWRGFSATASASAAKISSAVHSNLTARLSHSCKNISAAQQA
jgi:transposase